MSAPALADRPRSAAGLGAVEWTAGHHPVFRLDELVEIANGRLAARLDEGEPRRRALLDAYLAVASICQLVSDHAHRDVGDLRRIRKYASRLRAPAGAAAALALETIESVAQTVVHAREGALARWLVEMEDLAGRLADVLWGTNEAARNDIGSVTPPDGAPLGKVAIPPRCFFTFDQRPEDCAELAARYARQEPHRDRPVLVIGVRTSGCFLAPIVAAALRRQGFSSVAWAGWRPGQSLLARDRRLLRQAATDGSSVLIVDDPPTSGGSVARVAREIAGHGVDAERITLLLQLFPGGPAWQERLAPWSQLRLEWSDWHVHRGLEEDAVANALAECLGVEIVRVTRLPGSAARARRHVEARYAADVRNADGSESTLIVAAQGVGVGWFGGSTAAIAAGLAGSIPAFFGVREGLLFRQWLPEASALNESDPRQREALAGGVARYAHERASRLGVPDDRAREMS